MIKRPKYLLKYNLQKQINLYLIIATTLVSVMGCASAPPSKTLPQSKVAVASIDHDNYRKHTASDVDAVKAKLKQAETFETEKQHESAEQLAQQILVDVELIQIRTQRMTVETEVKQIESGISNLNEELKWREPIKVAPLNQ